MANEALAAEEAILESVKAHVEAILGEGAVMMLPTLPGPAPRLTADASALAQFRTGASLSFAIGGLAGVPWLTLPLGQIDGAPVGLSLVGAVGTDRRLVMIAAELVNAARESGLLSSSAEEPTFGIAGRIG